MIWQTRWMSAWKMWLIICWFAGIWQRWGIQFTPSVCYTRSSKQTLCLGLEGQKVFEKRGKNESRAYDEPLQINWPPESPHRTLYRTLTFTGLKFSHQIFSEAATISLLNMCQVSLLLIHFLQRSTNLTKHPVSFPITSTRVLLVMTTHFERQ